MSTTNPEPNGFDHRVWQGYGLDGRPILVEERVDVGDLHFGHAVFDGDRPLIVTAIDNAAAKGDTVAVTEELHLAAGLWLVQGIAWYEAVVAHALEALTLAKVDAPEVWQTVLRRLLRDFPACRPVAELLASTPSPAIAEAIDEAMARAVDDDLPGMVRSLLYVEGLRGKQLDDATAGLTAALRPALARMPIASQRATFVVEACRRAAARLRAEGDGS
jgi:hypothetical protein